MSLVTQITLQAFEKWVVDFVIPINPPRKRIGARYIITAMDYLTRWYEPTPVKGCTVTTTVKFLFDNVVTIFECLKILTSDQSTNFVNQLIK